MRHLRAALPLALAMASSFLVFCNDGRAQTAVTGARGNADGSIGTAAMRRANRAAGEIVQQWLELRRPGDLARLRGIAAEDVLVFSGDDRAEDILAAMGVAHTASLSTDVIERAPLPPTRTLFFNCPGSSTDAVLSRLRDFVTRGGAAVSVDWGVAMATRLFPSAVAGAGSTGMGDDIVGVTFDPNDPLVRDLATLPVAPRWWLEGHSKLIRIVDKNKARVLASSKELANKHGEGAMMVDLRLGAGRFLHMTNHFFLRQAAAPSERERAPGSAFARAVGLTPKELATIAGKGVDLDKSTFAELTAAFSMQVLFANLLVDKAQANEKLRGAR